MSVSRFIAATANVQKNLDSRDPKVASAPPSLLSLCFYAILSYRQQQDLVIRKAQWEIAAPGSLTSWKPVRSLSLELWLHCLVSRRYTCPPKACFRGDQGVNDHQNFHGSGSVVGQGSPLRWHALRGPLWLARHSHCKLTEREADGMLFVWH